LDTRLSTDLRKSTYINHRRAARAKFCDTSVRKVGRQAIRNWLNHINSIDYNWIRDSVSKDYLIVKLRSESPIILISSTIPSSKKQVSSFQWQSKMTFSQMPPHIATILISPQSYKKQFSIDSFLDWVGHTLYTQKAHCSSSHLQFLPVKNKFHPSNGNRRWHSLRCLLILLPFWSLPSPIKNNSALILF